MLTEQIRPSGYWSVCEVRNGHLVRRVIDAETREEAEAEFRSEFPELVPFGWDKLDI